MAVEAKYPITLGERMELGDGEVCLPGSFEDYTALLDVCEYPIEFEDKNIIAMSIASDPHERIVANLLGVLFVHFKNNSAIKRYGSNRHVYIPEFNCAYSPDVSVVLGEPDLYELRKGLTANLNPWMVTEVLSDSTRNRDFGKKLFRYKRIPAMRFILFIEQDFPLVTVHRFDETDKRWISADHTGLEESFEIAGEILWLKDIYDNITFP